MVGRTLLVAVSIADMLTALWLFAIFFVYSTGPQDARGVLSAVITLLVGMFVFFGPPVAGSALRRHGRTRLGILIALVPLILVAAVAYAQTPPPLPSPPIVPVPRPEATSPAPPPAPTEVTPEPQAQVPVPEQLLLTGEWIGGSSIDETSMCPQGQHVVGLQFRRNMSQFRVLCGR
jgi:outer membrane biosynthesis protein TonB